MDIITTTKVVAPDIVCGGCVNSIKNALTKVGGVINVNVDIDSKEVTIEHSGQISRESLLENLDKAGFPAS